MEKAQKKNDLQRQIWSTVARNEMKEESKTNNITCIPVNNIEQRLISSETTVICPTTKLNEP